MNLHQQLAASLITPSSIFEPKANFATLPSAELCQSLSELTSRSFDPVTQPVIQQTPENKQVPQQNIAIPAAFGKVTRPAGPLRYTNSQANSQAPLQAPQIKQALAMLQEIRNKNKAEGPRIIGTGGTVGSSSFRSQFDLSTRSKIYPPKSHG